ncbi:stabilin-2-like isoform X2 [Mercenaria mercenaria]|uniref:stabilin-2-like isoform X2 n=1 Tax=Mercenaria mercenaria TaxID=6596 RepID=UPI00234E521B|nr:stabilin-2-like isoform X2 [Mercenaria mercenaria]
MTLLGKMLACIFFILINVITVKGSEIGFCRETVEKIFETDCTSCHINVFIDCPVGAKKLTKMGGTSGCTYEKHLGPGPNITMDGCTHTCEQNITTDQCCKGFWGPKCDECPGGYNTVCSGHGACSDLIDGTGQCTCEAGRTGYACEFCTNSSVGGENCTQATVDGLCTDVICPNNSKCVVIDGDAVCMCNTSGNTSQVCKEFDACMESPMCHADASCVLSDTKDISGLGKNCTCNSGFQGDGYQCDPIDPCQVNNGGCDLDTSVCNYVKPGKGECMCKDGYENHVLDEGCSLLDVCALNTSACHPKALCETVAPNEIRCTCNEGYQGDGRVCYGNILQTIEDLDESDSDLKGQMTLIKGAIEKYYKTELTQHAAFTMFVPTNEGFRTINTADYQEWLNNKVRVRQILRQHIVVGQFTTEKLVNHTVFHTLQGTPAELMVAWRSDILKFRLLGSSKKAKIVRGNIVAANGIIHIVNKLLTNSPYSIGSEEKTVYENIKKDGKYNRFETLVERAGSEIKDIIMSQNVTAFVPNNAAFDSLPIGALDFLTSDQGKGHLIALLKNHIFENIIEITDLINTRRITSLAKISSWVAVTLTGQVQLNAGINITQTDIAASNGLIHDIDDVLVTDDISILPNNCDLITYKEVMGPCDDCRVKGRCFPPDVELNTTVECQYYAKNSKGKYVRMSGCALMCNRTYTTPKCCDGFYGFDCLPCPGGHENVCNGRGKCDEGYFGKGTCACDGNFGGDACDTCADNKHFGPNCTQECTCMQGVCNSGLEGDGKCKYPCNPLYMGENCDIQAAVCNDELHQCHVHAKCIWIEKDLSFRCICLPGYSGSGQTCTEIDPCKEAYTGGCHLQASCVKTGPGTANCTCNKGWTGDGKHCHMETVCTNHVDCHKYAKCIPTTPGKHICVCKDDFIGNGTYCLYKDRCEVNNGGCHPLAKCSHDDRSEVYVNCTCPIELGYSGNGFSCHGNIIMEIENHPKLTVAANLLKQMKSADQQLLLDNNYTIFISSDEGMRNLSLPSHKFAHWIKPENMIQLLNYHTLLGSYTLDKLVAESGIKKLQTMADGFSIYITKGEDGNVRLLPQRTGTVATVIESDIIATNGYINIIDKGLEPYEPMSPEDYPDLETFFSNHSEYSIFAGWLKDKNITYKLENLMDSYTLFIPNNEVAKTINRTVTTDYLRYYIVPALHMMASAEDGDTEVTDLGMDHQLVISFKAWNKYAVNGVPILKADMFTYGGLVNEIGGLLHPVIQTCDEKNSTVDFGPCTVCQPGLVYPCIDEDAVAVPDKGPFDCMYTENVVFGRVKKKKGCQGLCVTQTLSVRVVQSFHAADMVHAVMVSVVMVPVSVTLNSKVNNVTLVLKVGQE